MRYIVTFQHRQYPVPQEETPELPGRCVAELLGKHISTREVNVVAKAPVCGEGGWTIWLLGQTAKYRLFVNTSGIGVPIRDCWVAAISRHSWSLLRLFKPAADKKLASMIAELHNALSQDRDCYDVQWWEESAFTKEVLSPGTQRGYHSYE